MKRLVYASIARALSASRLSGPVARAAGYASPTPAFHVLTYHRVNDDADPFFGATPTDVFERHMKFVAGTSCVLTVEDLVERARRRQLPRNALAITFDDGYRDTLTHAAPILARYGLPATVFLATGFIGGAQLPWYDRVALALKSAAVDEFISPWRERVRLGGVEARLVALDGALSRLKALPDEQRRMDVERLVESLGGTDEKSLRDLMLTWDDVQALRDAGFSIGAHTVSHPILSRVSPERAWNEIQGSKAMIEAACGVIPRAFAYPNGRPEDYNETVVRFVRQAGFVCAVTTQFGVNSRRTPPYELRRGGPWEHDLPTFALKLAAHRVMAR